MNVGGFCENIAAKAPETIRVISFCSILSQTLKRYLPPGESTRRASRNALPRSGKNITPNWQIARSKAPSG